MTNNLKSIISPEELSQSLNDPSLLIVDCSFTLQQPEQGYKDYLALHIPDAVYAHLDHQLSGKCSPITGRHPLPSAQSFQTSLSNWGYTAGRKIVAYDATGGTMAAARLWWLCSYFSIPESVVLDGGITTWLQLGLPVTSIPPKIFPSPLINVSENQQMIASFDEIRANLHEPRQVLLDGRATNRYFGLEETIDTLGGHIPGAISLPVSDFLDENMRFKSNEEIVSIIEHLLPVINMEEIIYYCGSGVTSALGLLAFANAGYPPGRLYPGSWSEWITLSGVEIAVK